MAKAVKLARPPWDSALNYVSQKLSVCRTKGGENSGTWCTLPERGGPTTEGTSEKVLTWKMGFREMAKL